jgi:hypothetical protein
MKTKQVALLLVSVAIFLRASVADAIQQFFSYNNVAGFSTTSNPSGPWSYQSVLIGALPSTATNMTFPDSVSLQSWATTYPTDVYTLIGPNGFMHPGNQNDSLLGFIYPLNYSANVSISVASRDGDTNPSSDGKLVSMWLNNTQLASQFLPGNYSGDIPWQDSLTMHPGDKFYLRMNRGSNNINFGDSQLEFVTIAQTSVPEPSALALLGLGAAGLGLSARRWSPRRWKARTQTGLRAGMQRRTTCSV